MKIYFACKGNVHTAQTQLESLLSTAPIETVVYDDLTVEVDADGSSIDEIPVEVADLINEAIDLLAEDYGIDLEIDSVSAI